MNIEIINEKEGIFAFSGIEIDLKKTFDCGQCFRWNPDNEGFLGIVSGKIIKVIQAEDGFIIQNTSKKDIEDIWIEYFDLVRDYEEIRKSLSLIGHLSSTGQRLSSKGGDYMEKAVLFGRGIRILKQPPAETLISFIISQNNNIPRIKKIIEKFCELYGKPIYQADNSLKEKTFYAFPDMEDFSKIVPEELFELKAGYRSRYIYEAVLNILNKDIILEDLYDKTTEDRKNMLLKIKGVGSKVADCVNLFAYRDFSAFPKDVWIKKVISELYGEAFDENLFGDYAGLAQQYLFHYSRNGHF